MQIENPELVREIISYSLEDNYNLNKDDKYFTVFDDLGRKFHDTIYLQRQIFQGKIIKLIKNSSRPIIIKGVTGSGKSSICRRILEKELDKNDFIHVILDYNILKLQDNFLNIQSYTDWIRETKNEIKNELIELFKKNAISKNTLLIQALITKNSNIIKKIEDIKNELLNSFSIMKAKGDTSADTFHNWLSGQNLLPEFYEKIRVMEKALDYMDLFLLYKEAKNFRGKLVVFFDNVDNLEIEQQQQTYKYVLEISKLIKYFIVQILNIRCENFRLLQNNNTVLPDQFEIANIRYNSTDNYKISPDDFVDLLFKRINHLENINGKDFDFKNYIEIYKKFTKSFKTVYSNESLINFANQSIRKALFLHSEFFNYLTEKLSDDQTDYISQNDDGNRILNALFYAWLSDNCKELGIDSFDISSLCSANMLDRTIFDECNCNLTYLLLAYISKTEKGVLYSLLLNEFIKVGFSEDAIKNSINKLYYNNNKEAGFLIEAEKFINGENDQSISTESYLWITHMGNIMLEKISLSFVFIHRNYLRSISRGIDDSKYFNTDQFMNNFKDMLIFLGKVANIHELEILKIQKKLKPVYAQQWLDYYYKKYCYKNKLQINCIIESTNNLCKSLSLSKKNNLNNDHFEYYQLLLNHFDKLYSEFIEKKLETNCYFDFDKFITDVTRKNEPQFDLKQITIDSKRYITQSLSII